MANVTQFNRTNAGEAILLDVSGLCRMLCNAEEVRR